MAARKATSTGSVKREDHPRVSQSGGRAPARKSVAGSNPRRRTAGEVQRSPENVVPNLPKRKPTQVAAPSDRYPTVDPAVIAAAFDRAVERNTWQHVVWDVKRQYWKVPSLSRSGEQNIVKMREPRRAGVPFYVKLECNCDAAVKGAYLVCYHKCAVFLYWKYNKLVEDALENGGEVPIPDDWEGWYRE